MAGTARTTGKPGNKSDVKKQEGTNSKNSNESWRASKSAVDDYLDEVEKNPSESKDDLDFSEKEKAETMKTILERFPSKPIKGPIPKMHLGYGNSKGHQAELAEKRKLREAWNNTVEAESKNSTKPEKQQESVKNENESTKEATTTADPEDVLKQLEAAKKKIDELSKANQSLRNTNNVLNESIKQRAEEDARKSQETANEEPKAEEVKTDNPEGDLSSSRDVEAELNEILKAIRDGRISDAQELADQAAKKYGDTSEPKIDNSAKTEEPVTPEGEAKVEGEPQAKTEQAQTTQESAKETNGRPGTGEVTKDNIISPEDAFKFFNNKENYDKASTVFKTPSFDEYIDATTGKWIPRSYFDAFNAKDGIDPKKFTFEHFKAKIPEDPGKQLTAEEKTADLYNKNKAEEDYEKEYKNFNTGFKAYLRRHPKLEKILKTGKIAGSVGILYGIGQMFNDAYTAGQNDNDELKNIIDGLNDDDPEPWVSNVNNNSTEDITKKLKDANESTETPEGDSGTIEQAVAEQAPAGNVEPENPQVASNEATPTNTKANNAPASTAESAPTQGLPPVVTRDAPPANPDSSGMTYSQRVEAAGQAPQAGSMAYNANNPDMVTANLINAMNQAPQAGSDAIGYGDLYDQNFIDFWAKRNPNLAFGVSQGRK